jgi:hypothetical protein
MIHLRARSTLSGVVTAIAVFTFLAGSLLAQTADSAGSSSATEEQSIVPRGVNPWAPLKALDNGEESSVAISPSGLIVEVHNSNSHPAFYSGLYYRIGKLDPVSGTVTWGSKGRQFQPQSIYGGFPSVAITKEGYVIIVYSGGNDKRSGRLRYYVGTLDPNGGTDQEINFKVKDAYYDTGWNGTISVNYNGVIAEAHGGDGSDGLFYRLGHLSSPGTGDFSIVWDTESGGKKYDNGLSPVISLNDNGDVVEVHKSENGDRVYYTRGKLSGSTIAFQSEHPKFDDPAWAPAVVLLNNGYVMEMNVHIIKDFLGTNVRYNLTYRLGKLDPNGAVKINWISDNVIWTTPRRSGLATNGTYAVATPGDQIRELKYTWAIAP